MIAQQTAEGKWMMVDSGETVLAWLDANGMHVERQAKTTGGRPIYHEAHLPWHKFLAKTERQLEMF
jgi:hypothetical protein